MASDATVKAVNGNYGVQPAYATEQPSYSQSPAIASSAAPSGSFGADPSSVPNAASNTSAAGNEGGNNISKDEVGWYFVEQYYTTLSKSPEKLHLFYSKRSQFVSGVEAEKVSVSVGQVAINDRIKDLDIQDCKVRVSNVDSQESFKNIVVQVIGEMSNKAAPHRKFVQTFVLAEQPKGYFVLNDIFRYINEEDEEEEEVQQLDSAVTDRPVNEEPVAAPTELNEPPQQQQVIEQVDQKLESEAQLEDTTPEDVAVDTSAEENPEDERIPLADTENEQPLAKPADDISAIPSEEAAEESAAQDAIQPEKPRDPEPTPNASPPKPVAATPVQVPVPSAPTKPAAPKTWANLVAANRTTAPAVTPSANSPSPASSQSKATPHSPTQPSTSPGPSGNDPQGRGQQNANTGWQTAGVDNARRQGRVQSISGTSEKETVQGYVKNVTERVDASILKSTLTQYGKLAYFDVSRQKNCAFVEFETTAGYNAAVAANPHSIGGEQIYVEERRPRPAAYGGFNARGNMRGGRGGADGRPNNQGRGNYPKDGGRGGFVPRGRGGNLTPRGRGQAQAA